MPVLRVQEPKEEETMDKKKMPTATPVLEVEEQAEGL